MNHKVTKESKAPSLPLRSKEPINSDEEDVIVLDDTIEELEPKTNESTSKQDQNDLETLLASFDSIKIGKENTPKAKSSKYESPKPESSHTNVYIPFSQRMKTIYKNASIFDK